MKIAVEGCAHGELEKIYDTIQNLEKQQNVKVDLLICCGDFQSTRNLDDLETMAVPKKFQDICTFYKYYSGEKLAPILTLFIGGNHEASNYLQELPYGGWVAPNIYYLGLAGVVKVNGIRIAGISGIYKGHDYLHGHHEFSPYNSSTIRSVYHVRQLEVFRLKQLSNNIDIIISHDWPRGVYNYGNSNQLIRFKPHFKEEIDNDKLGSPPCADLLNILQPIYWFAAHLHCKFAALIPHDNSNKTTKFLALDKCLPKRRFLQIIDIETENTDDTGHLIFEYDLEWLTILFITNHLLSTKASPSFMPGPNGKERFEFTPTDEEKQHIFKKFNNDLIIPNNFCRTVESYNPNDIKTCPLQPKSQINPQTTQFCDTLSIDDPVSLAMLLNGHELSHSSTLDSSDINNSSSFCQDSEDQQSSFNSSCDSSFIQRKIITMNLPEPNSLQSDEIIVENEDSEEDEKIVDKDKIEDASESVIIDYTVASLGTSENLKKSVIVDNTVASIDPNKVKKQCEVVEDKPPIKKFKRRNQSIYAITDDNNDE